VFFIDEEVCLVYVEGVDIAKDENSLQEKPLFSSAKNECKRMKMDEKTSDFHRP